MTQSRHFRTIVLDERAGDLEVRLQLFNVDPAELVHRHLDQVPPPQPQDVGALQQVIQYKRGELCSTIYKANNRSSF